MSPVRAGFDARNCLRSDMQNWTYQSAEKEFDRHITAFYR